MGLPCNLRGRKRDYESYTMHDSFVEYFRTVDRLRGYIQSSYGGGKECCTAVLMIDDC